MLTKPSLTLKRRLNGAPEKVFAAWTDPEKIVKWFGPDAGPVKSAVLDVRTGGRYAINRQPVGAEGLESAVARTFAGRPRKVLFVKGGEGLTYGEVIAAVDATRAAGVQVVGLVPRPGEA